LISTGKKMNTETYDNETVNAYLLGALPEAEAERFDELSFTDDRFADALSAAEKNLIDSYVNGELSGARLEQFKNYYLASPLRREKVEFARAFQSFAEKKMASQTAAAETTTAVTDGEISRAAVEEKPKGALAEFFSNLFSVPRLSLQWGLAAATLAFLFFAGWLMLENSRLRRESELARAQRGELQRREAELENEIAQARSADSGKEAELERVRGEIARLEQSQERERRRLTELEQERQRLSRQQQQQQQNQADAPPKQSAAPPRNQISVASFILAPSLRGGGSGGQIQTLSIPEKTDAVAMRLELEPNDYAAFRVALVSQSNGDGRVLWRSGSLKARATGDAKSLNVSFPAKLLKSSDTYTLEVSGVRSSGGEAEIIGNYSFRTVLK
jgi:hypothetical protein